MVIGLEVHCELSTASKIFCGCTTKFGGAPNTHVCEVCSGMPGTLPTLNRQVVEFAVKAGLALNCDITRNNKFDRKNYFYPDLPKAYQISQLYCPICRNGHVDIKTSNGMKSIGIHEIHMEEDAGKLVHDEATGMTRVDFNRCGVPLLEIVSEPDFRSAEEVIAYLTKIRDTMQYLGVSDCKMQEGSMRADVNLSVRPRGQAEFGTRTEMKNIASFKAIERAIEYECERQIDLIEGGGKVVQETRRWDDEKEYTYAMRSKEDAQDYKYFPDPDLMPVVISEEYLESIKAILPEFADAKRERYVSELGLTEYDADIITGRDYHYSEEKQQGHASIQPTRMSMITFFTSTLDHQSSFIKRELFNNSLYREDLRLVSDWVFFLEKVVIESKLVKFIPDIVCYREVGGITWQQYDKNLKEREQYIHQLLPSGVYKDYSTLSLLDKDTLFKFFNMCEKNKTRKILTYVIKIINRIFI